MSVPIESYALLGDLHGAALVSASGSIDWLVTPRFDSASCFSALLGEGKDGYWRIAPVDPTARSSRSYRGETLVLETTFTAGSGVVRLTDGMLVGESRERRIVRVVEGVEGEVEVEIRLVPRFDYGSALPWLRSDDGEAVAISGPDGLALHAPVKIVRADRSCVARLRVSSGERIPFVLTWFPSHLPVPGRIDALGELERTVSWWSDWSGSCSYEGPHREAVIRSLLVLKALSYQPTGAIVAAPTTSLPEAIGGQRNWDYRYCWLRDAAFTVLALLNAGYRQEAQGFVAWLTRAVAGDPSELQVLYAVAGERRLDEREISWLAGYEGSRPVRVGNAAHKQFQLDVYGEIIDTLYLAVKTDMEVHEAFWEMLRGIVDFVRDHWEGCPDAGMWEFRGGGRQFVESRVMAWVVFDRAVKLAQTGKLRGPVDEWRAVRDRIHAEVLERGFDAKQGTFVQSYGSKEIDASLLLIAQVGFLPPDDPRIVGTVKAVERELFEDPFVHRYSKGAQSEHFVHKEGAFIACSFWLCDMYAMQGRLDEARALFERILRIRNDVGLLSEEYDTKRYRMLGNFPQAFSHLALVTTAYNLIRQHGPAKQRAQGKHSTQSAQQQGTIHRQPQLQTP